MSAIDPPPNYSSYPPPPAYPEQNSNWSYPVAYYSTPGNNSLGAANPQGFVVIQDAVPVRTQDGCCRGCACICPNRQSMIICGLTSAWVVFASMLIVFPLTAAFVLAPYSKATRFVPTQCTVVSFVMGTITTTCSCGRYCSYSCKEPCDRVQVTFTSAEGLDFTANYHTDEGSLNSECFVGDVASGPCWYNPDDEQQVFRSKTFQLADAVNALFWPLLLCVGSFIFVVVLCKKGKGVRPIAVIH